MARQASRNYGPGRDRWESHALLRAGVGPRRVQRRPRRRDRPPPPRRRRAAPRRTAPERPASTTTTAFDPASVEGEVEAAYLKSWDVYADAVYDLVLDEEALAEVYAEDAVSRRSARRSSVASMTASGARVASSTTTTIDVVDEIDGSASSTSIGTTRC